MCSLLFFSETFKVNFSLSTLPEIEREIQRLNLQLVSGECEVNCNGSESECDVSLQERDMTDVSISEQTSH